MILAHQFVTGAKRCDAEELQVGALDQIPAELFEKFDYAALGHIHSPQKVERDTVRDYLLVTLTDEEDVPDGMAKLRTIYPNLMRLEYDNKRTRSAADIGTAERVEEKSELELFREFYELQNNQSMTAQQKALVEELLRGMKA